MQNDLDTDYPELDIQILGVNAVGRESENASVTSGRDIPWLQDDESDIWTNWGITYRDVVIVDADNVMVEAFNLSYPYSLQNANVYDTLKQKFINTASIPDFDGDFNGDGAVDAADYTVWRDGESPDSTAAGYALWAANFDQSAANGSEANPVPEPVTLLLVLMALAAVPLRMRHR
jgi:hypothetical protein